MIVKKFMFYSIHFQEKILHDMYFYHIKWQILLNQNKLWSLMPSFLLYLTSMIKLYHYNNRFNTHLADTSAIYFDGYLILTNSSYYLIVPNIILLTWVSIVKTSYRWKVLTKVEDRFQTLFFSRSNLAHPDKCVNNKCMPANWNSMSYRQQSRYYIEVYIR